jgi:hypothetical protein
MTQVVHDSVPALYALGSTTALEDLVIDRASDSWMNGVLDLVGPIVVTAVTAVVVGLLVEYLRGRRHARAPEPIFDAAIRLLSERGLAGRWRHGLIRRGADGFEWIPQRIRSVRRRPIFLGDVVIRGRRSMGLVELIFVNTEFSILECDAAPGQVLLAVPEESVETLAPQGGEVWRR